MTATGYVGSDPTKVNKAGDIMTGLLILSGDPTTGLGAATQQYVLAHGGGGGGTSVKVRTTGPITSGDVNVGSSFTQVGTDLTIPAATGDQLELLADVVVNASGSQMQFEAATRVSGADHNYWSSGISTSLYPGGIPSWIVDPVTFTGPRPAMYTVQASDIVAGNVTVRFYGRVGGGTRVVFADTSYPLRLWLKNFGAGT